MIRPDYKLNFQLKLTELSLSLRTSSLAIFDLAMDIPFHNSPPLGSIDFNVNRCRRGHLILSLLA